MSSFCIRKGRVNALKLPKGYEWDKVTIGIPATCEEAEKVGLKDVGDAVLPSGEFGPVCMKNAYGASYPDKTKEKEYRYVSTVWTQPYGNGRAYPVAIDMYRNCYPKTEVPPTETELVLWENERGEKYILAHLANEPLKDSLKDAVNIFLEIFGYCYVFSEQPEIIPNKIRKRCNWKILPPGKLPSENLREWLLKREEYAYTFDVSRLEYVEQFKAENIVEGINGFSGYYAFLFQNHCVLESAIYGNATYIIAKENWEELSQKTKGELTQNNLIKEKIVHRENWYEEFSLAMQKLENQ